MTLLSQWNDSQTVKEAAVRGSVRGDCKPEKHKTAFSQRVGGRPLTAAVDGSFSCTWVWQKHCETLSTSVVRRSKHQVDVPGGSEAAEHKHKFHPKSQSWFEWWGLKVKMRQQVVVSTPVWWCWPMKGKSPGWTWRDPSCWWPDWCSRSRGRSSPRRL